MRAGALAFREARFGAALRSADDGAAFLGRDARGGRLAPDGALALATERGGLPFVAGARADAAPGRAIATFGGAGGRRPVAHHSAKASESRNMPASAAREIRL